jgi:hypothetical protein
MSPLTIISWAGALLLTVLLLAVIVLVVVTFVRELRKARSTDELDVKRGSTHTIDGRDFVVASYALQSTPWELTLHLVAPPEPDDIERLRDSINFDVRRGA